MNTLKSLCDLDKKAIKHYLPEVCDLIHKPKFICLKCARAARDKDYLCKPAKLKK